MATSQATTFFHGGAPGRRALDWLEPPSATGARSMASYAPPGARAVIDAARPGVLDESIGYITTDRQTARAFAAVWCDERRLGGSLYEVRPEGDVDIDPDCPDGTSFRCRRALVVKVHALRVVMTIERALEVLERV